MPRKNLLVVMLGSLLFLGACSKHEDQLRAEGMREITGRIFLAQKDGKEFKLAHITVVAADLEESMKNFKQLKDKIPAGPERDKLTADDYRKVLGATVVGEKTDENGKFKLLVPEKKPVLLCAFTFAAGEGNKIIPHCWMIRVTDATTQNYDLSDRNMLPDAKAVEDLIL